MVCPSTYIYTRDDSSGLWSAKPAFQPDSILLSSPIKDLGGLDLHSTEDTCMGHMHHDSHQELTNGNGATSMETSYEHVSDEVHSRDEVDVEVKKRRVEEDLSADRNVVADYPCLEQEKLSRKIQIPWKTQS